MSQPSNGWLKKVGVPDFVIPDVCAFADSLVRAC